MLIASSSRIRLQFPLIALLALFCVPALTAAQSADDAPRADGDKAQADEAQSDEARPSVLFVGSNYGGRDRHYRKWDQWLEAGFEIDARELEQIQSYDDLRPFNVIVITTLPKVNAEGEVTPQHKRFAKWLDRHLQAGGGALAMFGGGRWQDYSQPLAALLEHYGATVPVPEQQVTDPDHVFGSVDKFELGCYTTSIADAPMTEGVDVVGYVGEMYGHTRMMLPLVIEDEEAWQVAVRGEQSAYSALPKMEKGKPAGLRDEPGAYASSPVLAAHRKVGKGRFFVFPQNIALTITSPEMFNGRLWDRPATTPAGKMQNRRLIHQTLRWLAEPTLGAGDDIGGYRTPRDHDPEADTILGKPDKAVDWSSVKSVSEMSAAHPSGEQRGLIGAQSAIAGGEHTVAELAAAAKDAGLDFLAFTEPLTALDRDSWQALKDACRQASDEQFAVLPGMIARDKVGNTWFGVGYVDFPEPPAVTRSGARVHSTLHFWAETFRKRLTGFADVARNPNPWYEMKHTSAFTVYTDENGKRRDEAEYEYLQASYNIEHYLPVRVSLMDSPQAVRDAADGMLNTFTAPSPAHVQKFIAGDAPYGRQIGKLYPLPWHLSAGPRIVYEGGENLRNLGTAPAKQNIFRYGFKLANLQAGDRIQLMDGADVFREWRADGETFSTEHTWPHEQQRAFVLRVVRDGRTVLLDSPTELFIGRRFQMVGDHQNTLPFNYQPDADGNFYVTGIPLGVRYKGWSPRTLVYGNYKLYLTGAVGVEYTPRQYASFDSTPRVPFDHPERGEGDGSQLASHQIHQLSCPGVIIVDEIAHRHYPVETRHPGGSPPMRTAPLELYQFTQRRYGIYGMLDQRNAQYIESEIMALRDVQMEGDDPSVRVSSMRWPGEPTSEAHVEAHLDGSVERWPFKSASIRRRDALKPGDYVGMYPYGVPDGGAQYAVTGELTSDLRSRQGHVFSRVNLDVPKQWQRGDIMRYEMLYSTGASEPFQDHSDYQDIARFLGLRDVKFPAIRSLEGGTLLDEPVIATIKTSPKDTVTFETRQDASDPVGLTMRVRGLNPSWQVAYILDGGNTWRYCGELEGDFYFNLYTNQEPHTVQLGHPVIANTSRVRVRLDDPSGAQSRFEVYNPTGQRVRAVLTSQAPFLPEQERTVTVAPYTSEHVSFEATQ